MNSPRNGRCGLWRWARGARTGAGLFCTALLAVALVACGGPQAQAEKAAHAWLDALNAGNTSAAVEMSTEATKTLLTMGAALGQDMAPGEYAIKEVRMNGDAAAQVVVRMQGEESDTTLELVQVGDAWKVGVKK